MPDELCGVPEVDVGDRQHQPETQTEQGQQDHENDDQRDPDPDLAAEHARRSRQSTSSSNPKVTRLASMFATTRVYLGKYTFWTRLALPSRAFIPPFMVAGEEVPRQQRTGQPKGEDIDPARLARRRGGLQHQTEYNGVNGQRCNGIQQ